MSKVIIIGAGGVASVAAYKCVENSEVFQEVCIASRTLSKAQTLVDKLSGRGVKLSARQVDADQVDQLVELFEEEKPDLVMNLA